MTMIRGDARVLFALQSVLGNCCSRGYYASVQAYSRLNYWVPLAPDTDKTKKYATYINAAARRNCSGQHLLHA